MPREGGASTTQENVTSKVQRHAAALSPEFGLIQVNLEKDD